MTEPIASVGGVATPQRPSMMDMWKASLAPEPEARPAAADNRRIIDAVMSMLQSLMPLIAQMAKSASPTGGGGAAPGAGQGQGGPGPADGQAAQAATPAGAAPKPARHDAAASPAAASPAAASPAAPALAATSATATLTLPVGAAQSAAKVTQQAGSGSSSITDNAGGVPQAAAISGIDPASTQVANVGSGSDKIDNVTNKTSREEAVTYSDVAGDKATIDLQPGQTGSFVHGSGDQGIRITPSTPTGASNPNETLFEDGAAGPGQAKGATNVDISKVDGNKDAYGNALNMTVTLSDGRPAGDGDLIHAYQYSTDDAASMGLAGDTSDTANIMLSDG